MEQQKNSRDHEWALRSWQRANKIAGGKCTECLMGVYQMRMTVGEAKQAVQDAAELELLVTAPKDKSLAEYLRGHALLVSAGEDKPKQSVLEEAHTAFQKSLELSTTTRASYFFDGQTLAHLGRNNEAATAFRAYVAHADAGAAMTLRAQHFAENPELARHKQAPPITITTLSGKRFNLDEMGGRVVLIDFWATWCGPCNKELPHMQKLARKFANEPFEMVSISWDTDEAKWKDFIQAHGMVWNQYRDADHTLSEAFAVHGIPHYFTIDSDGVLTAENVGAGSMADSRIEMLVKRAREAAHPDATAVSTTAGAH